MADGKDCECGAYGSCECGCDADWTPQKVYDLQKKVKELEAQLEKLAKALRNIVNPREGIDEVTEWVYRLAKQTLKDYEKSEMQGCQHEGERKNNVCLECGEEV